MNVLRTMLMAGVVATLASAVFAQGTTPKQPEAKPPATAPERPAPAQGNPPAAQDKPSAPAQELPDEAKAFNAAAGVKDPLARVAALEQFVADHPDATAVLLAQARAQMTSSLLAALKDATAKYQALTETELEDAKKRTDTVPLYSFYTSRASRLLSAGVFSEEAEGFARKGLAELNEATYTAWRKKTYETQLASFQKQQAAAKEGKPAQPAAARPETPASPNYRFTTKDGITQAAVATPPPQRPATTTPPRAPTAPRMPTDEEIKAGFKTDRILALSNLGQILMKRGKTDEGSTILKEAYAANPAASTKAAIARALYEPAREAGDEAGQVEYLAAIALSGRITADETKEFEALYRKMHGGSLDGLEKMLDERYARDHVRFAVTPYARAANEKPTGRAVLAEIFPGAG